MKPCGFEKELSLALHDGRWPAACDPALREHAAACASCSDLVLVTETLQRARVAASSAAVLPAPGVLWWRAQVRRRNGAVERMTRPIVFVEVVALAATLVALGVAGWRWFGDLDWTAFGGQPAVSGSPSTIAGTLAALPGWMPLLFLVGAAIFFAIGGLAVFVLAHNE